MSNEYEESEVENMDSLKKKTSNTKRALTISEASEYACVSEGTIRNWLAKKLSHLRSFPAVVMVLTNFALYAKVISMNFLINITINHNDLIINGLMKILFFYPRIILKDT